MSGRICGCGCNHAQSHTRFLYDSQWKVLHCFAGDRGWNHHGGKFCTPVFVLYQSSWKFCVSFYIWFIALSLDYYLLHAIVHVLQLRVGTKQPASEFCAWCQMFYDVGNSAGIPKEVALLFPLQKLYTKYM